MSTWVHKDGVWRATDRTSGGRGTRVRVHKGGVWVDSLENLQAVFLVRIDGVWIPESAEAFT